MNDPDWQTQFRPIWDRALQAWRSGNRTPERLFTAADRAFLGSIGCTAQELFDFVEDHVEWREPDFDTVLAVTSIRRDYFLNALGGLPARQAVPSHQLPSKEAAVGGIPWLPRILAKARLKLRGELPPDLMYGCGGDRGFLGRVKMTLPEFLQLVRDHIDDEPTIVARIQKQRGRVL